jgi:phosphatidylserine decarboxylase
MTMTLPWVLATLGFLISSAYWYWRYIWFFRNPPRHPPEGESVLSPADGTVVYVKVLLPGERVISIKQGVKASVNDIVRAHLAAPKVLIGIFMSPFNIHYNRAPISGKVEYIRHHPSVGQNRHMGRMHLCTLMKRAPYYHRCTHIVKNERTVTRIDGCCQGRELSCYVVQIGARMVHGIDSYVQVGERIERGSIFGMIRIGSQVDLVVPWVKGMTIQVRAGQRVRAGETALIEWPGTGPVAGTR